MNQAEEQNNLNDALAELIKLKAENQSMKDKYLAVPEVADFYMVIARKRRERDMKKKKIDSMHHRMKKIAAQCMLMEDEVNRLDRDIEEYERHCMKSNLKCMEYNLM